MCSLKKNEINWINSGKRRWLRPLWLWKFLDSLTNGLLMQQIFVEVPVIFIYAEFLSWNPSLPRVRCHLHHAENSLFHRNLKENNRKWHTIQLKNLVCVLTKCLGKIIFHIYFIHNKSHHCTAFRIITIQNCTCFVFNIYIQHITDLINSWKKL